MNEEGSVHGTEGEGSRVESGTAAAAAAAAGLTTPAHEQQAEEEAKKRAAEQEAHEIYRQLDAVRIGGKQRAPYWKTLVPVLVPVVGRLKCIKGGDGVCGKLEFQENCGQQKITALGMAAEACG